MILSSLVFVGVIKAEEAEVKETEVREEQNVEVKSDEQKTTEEKKIESDLEMAKRAREIKAREEHRLLELAQEKKEAAKKKLELAKEAKQKLEEKKKEVKAEIKNKMSDRDELEDEATEEAELNDDNENDNRSAEEHMSEVAKHVKILLENKEEGEGIGQEVRKIAQDQADSQERIAAKLAKMEAKKVWLKKMTGYDREAVDSVKEEIAAIRLRIQEIHKLQESTTDKETMAELEDTANSLIEQNAALDDKLQVEMKDQGVWGWFRNIMRRN